MARSLLSAVRSHPRLSGLSKGERREVLRRLDQARWLRTLPAFLFVFTGLVLASLPFHVLVWRFEVLQKLESTRTPDYVFFPTFLATLMPGLLVVGFGLLLFFRVHHNRLLNRIPAYSCVQCGYDLSRSEGRPCPECGAERKV